MNLMNLLNNYFKKRELGESGYFKFFLAFSLPYPFYGVISKRKLSSFVGNVRIYLQQQHSFHIVPRSKAPFTTAMSLFFLLLFLGTLLSCPGFVTTVFSNNDFSVRLFIGFLLYFPLSNLVEWAWAKIYWENSSGGFHTKKVVYGLKVGFVIFVLTELFFFVSFFWAFFHSSLIPSIAFNLNWPPRTIIPFIAWWELSPRINTMLLLLSGACVTYAHHAFLCGMWRDFLVGMYWTVALGLIFTKVQFDEYLYARINMNDGAYGSVFYLLTGFHGFHVILGLTFLLFILLPVRSWYNSIAARKFFGVCPFKATFRFVHWILMFFVRIAELFGIIKLVGKQYPDVLVFVKNFKSINFSVPVRKKIYFKGQGLNVTSTSSFKKDGHGDLDVVIWYWHFVDAIWLFVFTLIYYWGGVEDGDFYDMLLWDFDLYVFLQYVIPQIIVWAHLV